MSSDWHVSHNIPESRGGSTSIENLRPLCSDCNLGMGSNLTIEQWIELYRSKNDKEKLAIDVLSSHFSKKKSKKRKRY